MKKNKPFGEGQMTMYLICIYGHGGVQKVTETTPQLFCITLKNMKLLMTELVANPSLVIILPAVMIRMS